MIRQALLSLALIATPAAAQAPAPTPYDRAIAAGYKALTLCSAMFVAGRKQADVEALELTGIYPEYDRIVPTLPAAVDAERRSVTVAFDAKLAPRAAQWTPWAGCFIEPIGWPLGFRLIPVPAAVARRSPAAEPLPFANLGAAAARLDGLAAGAIAAGYGSGTRTTATLVVQRGRIVAERYAEGFGPETAQRTWSVAKSLAGTWIGTAVQSGLVKTADPAPIAAWDVNGDPRGTITLDNLMRMASGLHSATAGNRTDAIYFGGTSVPEEATAWPLEAVPGTRFRYANTDILLATFAVRDRDLHRRDGGPGLPDPNALFDTLGMVHTTAEQDWRGNFILSSQVWSTARDLARFGQLYLQDGVWNGQRLLPEGWVKYVTTPSGPQPEGDFGYGATFWLMNRSPGVPADTYAAFGNRGQYVVIVPSRKVVIVRRGEDPTGARFDIAKFTADVLAALK